MRCALVVVVSVVSLVVSCASCTSGASGAGSAPASPEPDAVPFVVASARSSSPSSAPASASPPAGAPGPSCSPSPREPVRPNPPGTLVKGPDGELVRCGPADDAPTSRFDDARSMAFGRIAVEPVRAVIQARAPCIRRCFEGGLRACPNLSDRMVVRFHVAPDGHVSAADVQATTLPDDVSACVLTEIRALRFPATGRGGITITYPFVFSP